jgi:hypothetical protein
MRKSKTSFAPHHTVGTFGIGRRYRKVVIFSVWGTVGFLELDAASFPWRLTSKAGGVRWDKSCCFRRDFWCS